MFVLNVIGKGANPAIFADLGDATILSPGFAFDIAVTDAAALNAARALAADKPWDINLVAVANRR